jgi:hypothetical protein
MFVHRRQRLGTVARKDQQVVRRQDLLQRGQVLRFIVHDQDRAGSASSWLLQPSCQAHAPVTRVAAFAAAEIVVLQGRMQGLQAITGQCPVSSSASTGRISAGAGRCQRPATVGCNSWASRAGPGQDGPFQAVPPRHAISSWRVVIAAEVRAVSSARSKRLAGQAPGRGPGADRRYSCSARCGHFT